VHTDCNESLQAVHVAESFIFRSQYKCKDCVYCSTILKTVEIICTFITHVSTIIITTSTWIAVISAARSFSLLRFSQGRGNRLTVVFRDVIVGNFKRILLKLRDGRADSCHYSRFILDGKRLKKWNAFSMLDSGVAGKITRIKSECTAHEKSNNTAIFWQNLDQFVVEKLIRLSHRRSISNF